METKKTAIILGAGPAGLTAAYELLKQSDVIPIVIEETNDIGGISKTINYKGNRIDIGGHRFFSKSERVMKWWTSFFPVAETKEKEIANDKVMLVRNRLSRIYYLRKLFSYPVSLSIQTLSNLGLTRTVKIFISYMFARMFPVKNESSLEDFMINRFGKELYQTFFKDYTEKLWGVPPSKISPEWGAQRIKGISISKVIIDALKKVFKKADSVAQKDTETSLIEKFFYPKYGPGQLWEEVAKEVERMGGSIIKNVKASGITFENTEIKGVKGNNVNTGDELLLTGDYFISSIPIKDLINNMIPSPPNEISEISNGLVYRDFITVGVLLKELKIVNKNAADKHNKLIKDTWLYIQEPEVKLGRIQIFNNWSPFMVKDPATVWIGLEYFCNESDDFWKMKDSKLIEFAINEIEKIDIINKENVLDANVIRMKKAYPAYFGTYNSFDKLRKYLDSFDNLFLVGRNGMHKYNNQDHSMLTAMEAVKNIIANNKDKSNIWAVNTEQDYHETKNK
jgi:protoporphyrinogen oxidase